MIRTDGRPTIAMRESEPILGQMTVEDCIAQAEKEELTLQELQLQEWEREQREAEPIYGGF